MNALTSPLTSHQRKYLKAMAHALKPVVMIGQNGLTTAVIEEAHRSLAAHELIKVRAMTDDRVLRETWLHDLCAATGAVPVQHLGKLLLIYRPAEKPRLILPA